MNAIEAVNHYAQRSERVDGVLQHLVISDVERLQKENEKLREALTKILDLNYFDLAKFETEVIEIAVQALRGGSGE